MNKKIILGILTIFICLLVVGCGGSTATGGKAKKFSGEYNYNPPKDNYYVETKNIEDDSVTITARIGKLFTLYEKDEDGSDFYYHANEDKKQIYTKYEGSWYIDSYSDYDEYIEGEEEIEPFYAMEDYFMKYFKMIGYENEKLSEYYIGNEKVAGVDCWVFDSKSFNAIEMKFWIDPSNGVTLKYINKESGSGEEVVKYNLNYKSWTNDLVPTSYEGIESL